eukprot:CAMPEP_0115860062 /NCGR_PEP_ID=MMETSP0287-20121206/16933_1 /TAXON_ID=412157 /ORGANISM="Chrysochromulina rotalis, Strain UIO044" /LENGTH=201 /DNA_ID=CAMNT_0003314373 /DNA_START=60 /DNA_END=666 /DNA_ORIENTATION=+
MLLRKATETSIPRDARVLAVELDGFRASADRAILYAKLHAKRGAAGAAQLEAAATSLSVMNASKTMAPEKHRRQLLATIAAHLHGLGEQDVAKVYAEEAAAVGRATSEILAAVTKSTTPDCDESSPRAPFMPTLTLTRIGGDHTGQHNLFPSLGREHPARALYSSLRSTQPETLQALYNFCTIDVYFAPFLAVAQTRSTIN